MTALSDLFNGKPMYEITGIFKGYFSLSPEIKKMEEDAINALMNDPECEIRAWSVNDEKYYVRISCFVSTDSATPRSSVIERNRILFKNNLKVMVSRYEA